MTNSSACSLSHCSIYVPRISAVMHPPPFRLAHHLSDWPDCSLELHCCQGTKNLPLRLLATNHGDRSFAEILPPLRCKRCNRPPAPVYLCAGHREHNNGAPADWAIELLPVSCVSPR
jgi:hypothetical protein